MRVFFGLFTAVAMCYGGYVLSDMEYGRRLSSIYLPISVATFLLWFIVSFIRAIRANKRDQALRAAGEETSSGPSGKRILINAGLLFGYFCLTHGGANYLWGQHGVDVVSAIFGGSGFTSVVLYFARYGQPLTGADRFDMSDDDDCRRNGDQWKPFYAYAGEGSYHSSDPWRSTYDD